MSWRWDKGQTKSQGSKNIDFPGKCDKNCASALSLVNMQEFENQISNSFTLLQKNKGYDKSLISKS